MKRYTFRLQSVLRVRRVQEEQARAAVLAARAELHHAEHKARATSDEYDRRLGEGRGPLPELAFAAELAELTRSADRVTLARARASAHGDEVDRRVRAWVESDRRVRALERLDERRREEHDLEQQRDEERTVDEIVTARARRVQPWT